MTEKIKSVVSGAQATIKGLFHVQLGKVDRVQKDYGKVLIFTFSIAEGEHKGRIVKGMCTDYDPLIPKCKLYLWAKALLGREPNKDEVIEWSDLVGAICVGEIVPKETPSGVFESVKRLFPNKFVIK